jgi:rhamnulokinase
MGAAAAGGSAFVASGTWMLAGVERDEPDTSEWARERNFTNEVGALDGFRFLRNVTGFWLFERCRASWAGRGDAAGGIDELLAAAEAAGPDVPLVDADDESLRAPDDMLTAYTALAGLPLDAEPGIITRSIVESIVARTAEVIEQVATVRDVDDIVLFGGAARMELLTRRLAEATGFDVRVGSAEAAALGNAIVQGVAIGTFSSLDDGRARISPTPSG